MQSQLILPNGHVVKKETLGAVNPQWRNKETLAEGSRDWRSGPRSAIDICKTLYKSPNLCWFNCLPYEIDKSN